VLLHYTLVAALPHLQQRVGLGVGVAVVGHLVKGHAAVVQQLPHSVLLGGTHRQGVKLCRAAGGQRAGVSRAGRAGAYALVTAGSDVVIACMEIRYACMSK
jgi:hypothetical protein